MVWVTNESGNKGVERYHTKEDCHRLELGNAREVDKNTLGAIPVCKICKNGHNSQPEQDNTYQNILRNGELEL